MSADLDNLLSQAKDVNLKTYRRLERDWSEAIKENKKVEVHVKIEYVGNAVRPKIFRVNYIIVVSLGLEYSNSQIDEIYLYGYMEEGSYFFNLFFKKNGEIIRLNQINDFLSENEKIDDSRDRQIQLLELGIDDLEKIEILFENNKKEVPTEIKIIYNKSSNSIKSKYSYSPISDDTSELELFNNWYDTVKVENNI